MPKSIDITPTANILHSLKRTGYHWSEALRDIIDNSIDALRVQHNAAAQDGGFVRIIPIGYDSKLGKNKTKLIVVADDGTGIGAEQLQEILRLGESGKRGTAALGTFGMGLKTAAMSLGTKLSIVSTTSTAAELRSVTWDVESCMNTGKFTASYSDNPTQKLVDFYLDIMGGDVSGTLIVIANLHEGIPTVPAIINTLNSKCAHTYRHMLNDNSPLGYNFPFKIIAGKTCAAKEVERTNDPLCVDHENINVLIGGPSGTFKTITYGDYALKIRMVRFNDSGAASAKARTGSGLGKGISGTHRQGVYWLREGREICCGAFWPPHPLLSNMYAEISFEDSGVAGESSPIRMDFGKKGVEMDDDLREYLLKHIFEPHLDKIRKESSARAKLKRKSNRTDIMKKVCEAQLPTEQFGRSKAPTKDRKTRAMEDIFSPPKKDNKTKRNNSKYRGAGVGIGENQTQLEFEECTWPGSTLPFCISYTVGDPVCKIQINVEDPWIEKNIYLCEDPTLIARNLQLIASMTVALMYESEEKRHELYIKMGALLNIFDDDFGRMESDLGETELKPVIISDTSSCAAEELIN